MFLSVYHPNSPEADRRPYASVRAERGLEAIEDAIAQAMTKIEDAVNAVSVAVDNYGTCYEQQRLEALAAIRDELDDLAAATVRRLEGER